MLDINKTIFLLCSLSNPVVVFLGLASDEANVDLFEYSKSLSSIILSISPHWLHEIKHNIISDAFAKIAKISAQYWPNLLWSQFNNTLQVTVL